MWPSMYMHTLKTCPHPHNHITTHTAEAHTDREKLTVFMDTLLVEVVWKLN